MSIAAIPKTLNSGARAHAAGERLRHRSRAIGVLAMSGFGALWAGAGLSSAPAAAWLVPAIIFLALGVRALRVVRANPPAAEPLALEVAERQRRAGRIFAWTSAGEGLGILLAVNVVVNLGHPDWQAAAAVAVVGLHFLPLAAAFGYRPHAVTGVALTAWALAWPWLFAAGAAAPAGLLGAGAILFASAAWASHSLR